jgi:hypothetical protein
MVMEDRRMNSGSAPAPDDPPHGAAVQADRPDGGKAAVADMREEFARMSARSVRDPAAERAFIEGKIEMLRTDPTMSEAEKAAAREQFEQRLDAGESGVVEEG